MFQVVEKWFGTAPPEWFKELINAYIKVCMGISTMNITF